MATSALGLKWPSLRHRTRSRALQPQSLLDRPFLRYLFLPNVVLLLLIGHLGTKLMPWVGVALLACVVAFNARISSTMQAIFFDGPSWRAQIPADGIKQPTTVIIWPPNWKITLMPR